MSTENSNPKGVVVLNADQVSSRDKQFVWIDFDDRNIGPDKKHEILRVIVGPEQGVVNKYRDLFPIDKDNFAPRGSCDNGKADVIFVRESKTGKPVRDTATEGALVGISKIKKDKPDEIIFAREFYAFKPTNRKKFAKLFC